ncbi:hypothetical protein D9M70_590540 [compost metagenome]
MLEVNFEVGIILPRGTPARSGVMHSTSSMPRILSQSVASFQVFTPRRECKAGGIFEVLLIFVVCWAALLLEGINHRFWLRMTHHNHRLAIG